MSQWETIFCTHCGSSIIPMQGETEIVCLTCGALLIIDEVSVKGDK
jgi:DNA-directed RNA polymerase subunit RPC12/RpoP